MQTRFTALLTMLVFALAPAVFASGQKQSKAFVSFHMETEATDNPKMIFEQMAYGKKRYFLRMPEITTKDMVSFSPFPSDAGSDDYGIIFILKENAAKRLAAVTNFNQGKWMIAEVNGRVVDGVLIDKQVEDGRIVIWKGVTLADVTLFDEALPRVGQEEKKKK